MTEMTDGALRAWLEEGPDRGSPEGLARALAATRRTSQRPGWSYPERWLPEQLTLVRAVVPRPLTYAFLVALLAVALVVAALWVGSQLRRVPAPFGPAANGLIAYENSGVIYLTDADNSKPRPITENGGNAFGPTFSRDGVRIAWWQRVKTDPLQLIVAFPDGSGRINVLAGAGYKALSLGGAPMSWSPPAWSPDGSWLSFTAKLDGTNQLVLARSDRTEIRVIATSENELALPAWSPDGRLIAVREITAPKVSILTMGLDGSDRRTLATIDAGEENAKDLGLLHRLMQWFEWSPKGDRIAFTGLAYVASVDLAGTVTVLAADPGDTAEFNPTWSPDGIQLAYFGSNGGSLDVAPINGSGYRRIGEELLCAGPIFWSPDGAYVIGSAWFATGCAETFFGELAAVEVATGRVTSLDASAKGMPTWQRLAR